MSEFILKLSNAELVADDTKSLKLVSVDDKPLPSYSAGAHIVIKLPNGEVRQYSLINTNPILGATTNPSAYLIGVRLENKNSGGSAFIHQSKLGDTFQVSGPFNQFPIAKKHDNTLLIAGGIGIAPIISMASDLKSQNQSFSTHYCARTRSALAFVEELNEICGDNLNLYCDDEPDTKVHFGALIASVDTSSEVYVCGPLGMVEEVKDIALKHGFDKQQIHFELFTPPKG